MDIKDRVSTFFTSDPQSFPTATSAPTEVISGRVAVHSVVGCCWSLSGSASDIEAVINNRAYNLCSTASSTDISFKFSPIIECSQYSGGPFQFNMGGNGILFPNGVFLGKDALAPNGETAVDLCHSITIFYTGGANT